MRKKFLFKLGDVLELNQSLLKCLKNAKTDISGFMGVSWSVVFEFKVNSEKRELLLVSSHLLDFILREVHVSYSVSVVNMDRDG
jgi:hypothetical protein